MSSKSDNTLLLPGANGWEVWQGTREKGFRRSLENGPLQASALDKLPTGRLVMAFPVREALAVPLRVQTTDQAMFHDLASMHLEKTGIRVEQGAGRLTDVFPAGHDGEQTSLLCVVLSAPREGSMPQRSPSEFDISARLFPMAENAVTIWQELGRWVFVVTCQGKLSYFQALPGVSLDDSAVREIRLALTQLSLQGVAFELDKIIVWTSGATSDPGDDIIRSLGEKLSAEVSAEPKPRPVLPDPVSKLVPADVRAEMRLRAERQQKTLVIAAILLVYLGFAGWLGYKYFEKNREVKLQQKELAGVRADYKQIEFFVKEWKQLAPVVDERRWPIYLLRRAHEAVPPGQSLNLRFKVFEATTGVDENGHQTSHIRITGESNDRKLANLYLEKLKKVYPEYEGDSPPPKRDDKEKRYTFGYDGNLAEGDAE